MQVQLYASIQENYGNFGFQCAGNGQYIAVASGIKTYYSIVQKMDFRMRNLKENKQNYNSMVQFPRNNVDFSTIGSNPDYTNPKIKQLEIRLSNLSESLRVDGENNGLLFARLEQRLDQLERRGNNFDREGSRVYTKNDIKERNSVGGGQQLAYFKQNILGELGAIRDEIRGQGVRGDQVETRQGRLQQELREWIGHQKQEISIKLLNQADQIRGSDIGRQRKYDSQLEGLRTALVALQEEMGGKMRFVAGLKQEMSSGLQTVRDEARGDKEAVSRFVKQIKQSFQALKDALAKDRQYVKEAIFELQSTNQDNFNKNSRILEGLSQSWSERQQKMQKKFGGLRDQWASFKLNANQKIEDCKSLIVNVESTTLEQLEAIKNKQGGLGMENLKQELQQWKKLTQQKNLNVFREISNAMKVLRMEWKKEHDDLSKQQQDIAKTVKQVRHSLIDRLEKELATISQLISQQFDAFTGELQQANDLIALSNKELKGAFAKEAATLTETISKKQTEMQKRTEAMEDVISKGIADATASLKGEIKQLQKATNAQIESLVGSITEDNEQWAKEINTMSNKLKESFSQEIKLAIQNQDKKTQEDGKKYQQKMASLKQSIEAGLITERNETVKQVSKATEQLTALINDWVVKGKKEREGSENGLKDALSQQKKSVQKDIADAKLIIEDLKTKAASKAAEDTKKNTELKTFIEQAVAKAAKTAEEDQAKNTKKIDSLKMQLEGKVKAVSQKIMLDINMKKDLQIKTREEESKLKTTEIQKKIADATTKVKTEVLTQINKTSKNFEEESSKNNKKIEAITTNFKKDLQTEVDKDKKFCLDEIAKVKSEIEIKIKAKEEKNLTEMNAKRDLETKQKDDELKGKFADIEKKITDNTVKTKSQILGEVTKAKAAQLQQLGKIKSEIEGKIKVFEELKAKKETDSKNKETELKEKENELKNKSAEQDKKIEALKKDILSQSEKNKKYCLDEIAKTKIEIEGKGNAKKDAEIKQKEDELKIKIAELQKKNIEAVSKSKAQIMAEINKSQLEFSKIKGEIEVRMKAFEEVKIKKEADSKAKQSQMKDKQADLNAKSAELDRKIDAAKKDLTKITMDEVSKLKSELEAKIQMLNQQINSKFKVINENTSKSTTQEKAKLAELTIKVDAVRGDIDKRLSEIKGAAVVSLKAQEQQTNKLMDQKLQIFKAYFTQAIETSTGATVSAFKGIDDRLIKVVGQTQIVRSQMRSVKDCLNKVEANAASEREKNKAVYERMNSDILDMADSITVMIAELRPAQK